MNRDQGRSLGFGRLLARIRLGVVALLLVAVPAAASAQEPAPAAAALAFDSVTVVDVEHGKLVPKQRVVIIGNRIQAVGDVRTVPTPPGAQVVAAKDKYLIPGLWDMHVHPDTNINFFFPDWILNGITGIRNAGSRVPLATQLRWRQEILAGTRVGPPRQILAGESINTWCEQPEVEIRNTCIANTIRYLPRLVDSLKAAGADMIKPRAVSREFYFAIAAAARRVGIPFGGHIDDVTAIEAADSGAVIIDHLGEMKSLISTCFVPMSPANVEECRVIADRLKRSGTWVVPTLVYDAGPDIGPLSLQVIQRAGLPLVAGTDAANTDFGRRLIHSELQKYVEEGLTPLEALQTATLNPAKLLHATDSLGTVAAGKLADLVLLDANPLADISATWDVHAVVANGRYFDRAALDQLLAKNQQFQKVEQAEIDKQMKQIEQSQPAEQAP